MIDFKNIKIQKKWQAFGYPIIIFQLRLEITLAVGYKCLNVTTYIQAEFIALWLLGILKGSLGIFNLNISFCFYVTLLYVIYQVGRDMKNIVGSWYLSMPLNSILLEIIQGHFITSKMPLKRCKFFCFFFNTAITRQHPVLCWRNHN